MSTETSKPPGAGRAAGGVLTGLLPLGCAALALGLLVSFTMTGAFRSGSHTEAASASAQQQGTEEVAASGPATFDVELGDLYVKPSSIDVAAGQPIIINVTNKGSQQHSLALEGDKPEMVDAGKSTTLHWPAQTRSTQAWCTVAGHKAAGMLLAVNVTGGGHDAHSATGTDGNTDSGSAAAGSAAIDPSAKPGNQWKPYDPLLRPADGAAVHEVTFHTKEEKIEVAPGVTQTRWSFNGTVPGPVLRGKVGDVFNVTLVNDGTMEHSIDFHASKVAPNVEMRTIKPGESLVYQFKADYAGIFYYHCGANPMLYHIGNGMYGALIVDPPDLGKVDKEVVLVQSELYFGPKGEPGDLTKMQAGEPDAVVFNGYYNQYAFAPIAVSPKDRIRVWLVDAGPNEDSAFHVVGTVFDTVWKEGAYTLRKGNPSHGGSQTLDLQPTQGGFVEFTLDRNATHPFITHKMNNMARGAVGVFVVGDGGGK